MDRFKPEQAGQSRYVNVQRDTFKALESARRHTSDFDVKELTGSVLSDQSAEQTNNLLRCYCFTLYEGDVISPGVVHAEGSDPTDIASVGGSDAFRLPVFFS